MPYKGETRKGLVLHWLGILLFLGILFGLAAYAVIALATTGDAEQIAGAAIGGPLAAFLLVMLVPMVWEEVIKPARTYWRAAGLKRRTQGA